MSDLNPIALELDAGTLDRLLASGALSVEDFRGVDIADKRRVQRLLLGQLQRRLTTAAPNSRRRSTTGR